ncbi:MAG: HAMP domain-containing histidine kinase [Paludibacteraceae bacterium]|nr:HAMP domain-containing histidine kinase [Paludibacteraceae bacterium]
MEHSAARLQCDLARQEDRALIVADQLAQALDSNSIDSIWKITEQEKDVLFYIYNRQGMVYWSQNWLAASHIYFSRYDTWEYTEFENAHAICRWSAAGLYKILMVIPIKYNYRIRNDRLRNTFLPAFDVSDKWDISRAQQEGFVPINSSSGKYLFSLGPALPQEDVEKTPLGESFSYQSVLSENYSKRTWHIYLWLSIIFLLALCAWGAIGLVRSHGWGNMSLSRKFAYALVMMLLVSYVYVFLVSVRFTQGAYSKRQRTELLQKAHYIQKNIQDIYYYRLSLSDISVDIDLRDLCYPYETDINVYDLSGNLVGSSSPAIFDNGLVSTHMLPEPFFSEKVDTVYQERIGDMDYLSAYVELQNGSYVTIGYIAVPSYISSDRIRAELDDFMARVLPYYLLIMLISVMLAFALSRTITRPLTILFDKLMTLKIGRRNAHLDYNKKDEIGQLVERYNEMVDELDESAERLARSEREGAWRTMARQIAHEINNPLTPMKLSIQQMQRLKKSGDPRFDSFFDHSTDMLTQQIDSLSRIASSFSSFAKLPEVAPAQVDIAAKLYQVITLFRNNSEHVPIRYVGAEQGVMGIADGEQIGQVFNNLLKNALQAISGRKNGDIIVMLKELPEELEISISDNGGGIPEDVQEKVFMPNFTTKSTGAGLGLAISKNIVEAGGGTITFSTTQKGTTFYVRIRK